MCDVAELDGGNYSEPVYTKLATRVTVHQAYTQQSRHFKIVCTTVRVMLTLTLTLVRPTQNFPEKCSTQN